MATVEAALARAVDRAAAAALTPALDEATAAYVAAVLVAAATDEDDDNGDDSVPLAEHAALALDGHDPALLDAFVTHLEAADAPLLYLQWQADTAAAKEAAAGATFAVGDAVLAPLPPARDGSNDDGGLHAARVESVAADGGVTVRFHDFPSLVRADVPADRLRLAEGHVGGGGGGACALCGRTHLRLTAHHLRPRAEHARLRRTERLDDATLNLTAPLCRACHSAVHRAAPNTELAARWNTVEALRGHPTLARFAAYAAGQRNKATAWDHAQLVSGNGAGRRHARAARRATNHR